MDGITDKLLVSAAKKLRGSTRRMFLAEVCEALCNGSVRQAEYRFGWGRETIAKGMLERSEKAEERAARPSSGNRGRKPWEERQPELAIDIRMIVEPHTHTDPELKTSRLYTNMSAGEVRTALQEKGYTEDALPSERTLRDILNRMNYRLKRIQKGKPLKKTEQTDAIFDNVKAVRSNVADDPATLEISVDTKAKVKLGEYSMGGKTRTDSDGNVVKAWDHDPPGADKLVPFGILEIATGLLTLVFSAYEYSDFWGDGLKIWWEGVRCRHRGVRRLVIYLDNGPKNSGVSRKFLRRMVQFADWSGLEIRLVYYPPYHSKYNPIERCWSSLQRKWNGVLLTHWSIVRECALRMTWRGKHPTVHSIEDSYAHERPVTNAEMKQINARLERSPTLGKYDIVIKPRKPRGR